MPREVITLGGRLGRKPLGIKARLGGRDSLEDGEVSEDENDKRGRNRVVNPVSKKEKSGLLGKRKSSSIKDRLGGAAASDTDSEIIEIKASGRNEVLDWTEKMKKPRMGMVADLEEGKSKTSAIDRLLFKKGSVKVSKKSVTRPLNNVANGGKKILKSSIGEQPIKCKTIDRKVSQIEEEEDLRVSLTRKMNINEDSDKLSQSEPDLRDSLKRTIRNETHKSRNKSLSDDIILRTVNNSLHTEIVEEDMDEDEEEFSDFGFDRKVADRGIVPDRADTVKDDGQDKTDLRDRIRKEASKLVIRVNTVEEEVLSDDSEVVSVVKSSIINNKNDETVRRKESELTMKEKLLEEKKSKELEKLRLRDELLEKERQRLREKEILLEKANVKEKERLLEKEKLREERQQLRERETRREIERLKQQEEKLLKEKAERLREERLREIARCKEREDEIKEKERKEKKEMEKEKEKEERLELEKLKALEEKEARIKKEKIKLKEKEDLLLREKQKLKGNDGVSRHAGRSREDSARSRKSSHRERSKPRRRSKRRYSSEDESDSDSDSESASSSESETDSSTESDSSSDEEERRRERRRKEEKQRRSKKEEKLNNESKNSGSSSRGIDGGSSKTVDPKTPERKESVEDTKKAAELREKMQNYLNKKAQEAKGKK